MLKVFAWRHFAHVYASTTEGNFLPPQKPQLCRALNRFLSMFFCVVCSDPVQKSNTHLPSFIISPLPLTTPSAYRPPLSINGEGELTGLYGWAAQFPRRWGGATRRKPLTGFNGAMNKKKATSVIEVALICIARR